MVVRVRGERLNVAAALLALRRRGPELRSAGDLYRMKRQGN